MLSNQSVGRVLGPRDFSRVSTGHMFARIWHRFYVFAVVSYILCDLSDWPENVVIVMYGHFKKHFYLNTSTYFWFCLSEYTAFVERNPGWHSCRVWTYHRNGRFWSSLRFQLQQAPGMKNQNTKTLQTFVDHENPALITGSIL